MNAGFVHGTFKLSLKKTTKLNEVLITLSLSVASPANTPKKGHAWTRLMGLP